MVKAPAYGPDGVLGHPDGWARARRILERAGVPLEVKVRSICRTFADEARERLGKRGFPAADRLIYGDLDGAALLREVDQLVRYYDEIRLHDGLYGVSLGTSVAIECKRREGIAFFGIRRYLDAGHADHLSAIPLATPLAGSQAVAHALAIDPDFLRTTQYSDIVAMRLDEKYGPKDLDKEQLVYKASASLYDYLKEEWAAGVNFHVEALRESGILEEAGIDYKHVFYTHWRHWLKKVPEEAYSRFNSAIFRGKGVLHFGADHAIALLCTDSPLYDVVVAEDGSLSPPAAAKWLRTSGRYQVGMARVKGALARPTPELDSFVVHVDHLREFLEGVLDWQGEQKRRLQGLPADVVEKAPFEASLRSLVAEAFNDGDDRHYTSEFESFD